MIEFKNISVTYPGGVKALNNVSLNITEGDFVIIVGMSGAGKSTLLRTINNLVKPTEGEVIVDSRNVTNASKKEMKSIRSDIGMIFQTFNLVNRSSVLKNVLTGRLSQVSTIRSIFGMWPQKDKDIAFESLNKVEILEKAYVRGSNLSGGQQQRVGIARAMVKKPALILADEPVASLDPMISFQVLSLLKEISLSQGITVLCNLHQVDFALRFADRIIGLSEGRIVMDKPVKEVDGEYIHKIYKGHNQGLFFGSQENQNGINDILSYKT